MKKMIVYHNPRCSKSRKTLELLQSHGVKPDVIEYLKTPLNLTQLKQLRAHFSLSDFVRSDEAVFKTLGLSLDNEEQIMQAMVHEPILMQRPIVICGDKAVIGRPPEKVLALL